MTDEQLCVLVERLRQGLCRPDWDTPEFQSELTRRLGGCIAQERTPMGYARARLRRGWDRVASGAWAVEEWWCRHVTHRELYRRLDRMRLFVPPDGYSPQDLAASHRRIAEGLAHLREREQAQRAGGAAPPC